MLSFAKDIKAIIDKEQIQRAILIGHSMGGVVIAEAARLMPERVIGIVGVDTLQNVAEHMDQTEIDEMVIAVEADFRAATQGFISPMFPEGTDKSLVNWVSEDMSSAPKEIALSAFQNYHLFYIEETGHFPMLEKPQKFNELLYIAIHTIELSNI